jgi:hypothetical protein
MMEGFVSCHQLSVRLAEDMAAWRGGDLWREDALA